MKIFKSIILILTCLSMLALAGCGSEDSKGPSEEEVYINRLVGAWQVESVSVDEANATSSFTGMIITIKSDKSFTVANAVDPIWPSSGSFLLEKIEGSNHFRMKRNDDIVITVTDLTENKWQYQFQYDADNGRASSVSGSYKFIMKK